MNKFLNDDFWIYVVIVIFLGAMFYFTPKLVKFLDKVVDGGKKAGVKKNEADQTADNNKSRYKTF